MIRARFSSVFLALLLGLPLLAQQQSKIIYVPAKIQQTKIISASPAAYPSLAAGVGIEGFVRMTFVVRTDGSVRDVAVLVGHPLLVQSALDAVRNWRYTPTLLDTVAVEVRTAVSIGLFRPGHGPDTAIQPFRKAVQKHPSDAGAHSALAYILWQAGELDEALLEYRATLGLKPDIHRAHFGIARVLQENGELSQAIAEYKIGLQARPKDREAHRDFASLLEETGEFDQAMAEYKEALHLGADDFIMHYFIGRLFVGKKDADGAIAELRKALKKGKNFPSASYQLGRALELKGDLQSALEQYRIAAQQATDNSEFRAAYERLQSRLKN